VYELRFDYHATINGLVISVPAGFQTDGASIPPAFQWAVGSPADPEYFAAALAHDWLYYVHAAKRLNSIALITTLSPVTRAEADAALRDLLALNGVWRLRRNAIYYAVRIGGAGHWNNDAEDNRYLAALAAQIAARGQNPADYGIAPGDQLAEASARG
jgi:hypothetical protein